MTETFVHITAAVERDYSHRQVFPELRLPQAWRAYGSTGIYSVSSGRACELLADAGARGSTRGLPRGLPVAYTALVRSLHVSLKHAAQKHIDATLARLEVGSHALYAPGDDAEPVSVVVIGGYRQYTVNGDNGAEYRHGYTVARYGAGLDSQFFAPAHALRLPTRRPSHLRAVAPARTHAHASPPPCAG